MLLQVHHDDTDDEIPIQEEKQEQTKTDSFEGVYLRQHQDGERGHIIMGRDSHEIEENVSGDSDQTRPFDTIGNDIIPTVLKGQRLVPQSSSKFGSVSYASALKRQGQSVHQEVIEENSLTLSPGRDTSLYSGESCTSVTEIINDGIIPLHGVLLDSMLPDSDDEGDRGSTHGYSPSQRQHTVSNNARSPSQYTTQPFPPPIPLSNIPKPYSNSSVFRGADSGMSGGVESPNTNNEIEHVQLGLSSHSVTKLLQEETRPSSAQSLTDSYSRFPKTSYGHLTDGSISPVIIGGKTAGGPLIRVSSAPSHLPLNIMGHNETRDDSEGDDDDDDTESVKTDDSVSTNSKSMLNIAANEFVPNQQLSRKKTPHKPSRDQQHTRGRGYQGQRGGGGGKGNMSVHNQKGHISHGKIHHNHFHQQQQQPHHHHHHHHTPQQPHPPPQQQQQPLINKPPIDILLQFLLNATHQQNLKNIPSNLLLRLPGSNLPIPLSTPQTHPSLPLSYPPQMTNAFPYQVPHPGILSQSLYHRKMLAQEGIPTPHGMPRPPIVNPTAQYTPGGGSKVHVPITPEGSVEMNQVPNVLLAANRPSYYTATPLHHNQTPPQLSAVMVPHHQVQLHHLPSTRPSHVPPLNIPQVPPPSLKLPRPVIGEQQSNSNSRPPLLPTPPGFNLVHQTSAVVTSSVTTPPSLHHPNWSVHPQAIRLGLPPNIQ